MKSFSKKYLELGELLDDRPDWAADWKWLVLMSLAAYCVTLALRLSDAQQWATAVWTMAGGETILSTHDSYAWLAGAKGVNAYSTYGMSAVARGLAHLTGAPLWKVGFWAPPFLASLTAVVTVFWGWLLGGRRAGIAAGLLGALSPGFYFRSRLGYFDSDVFTLLMPLLIAFMLAWLVSFCCSRTWLRGAQEADGGGELPGALPWLALGFGLVTRFAHFAHDDVHVLGVVLYLLALGLTALTGRPGRRLAGMRLLIVYGLAAYAGNRAMSMGVFALTPFDLLGIAVAAALAALLRLRPEKLRPVLDHPWVWLALFLAMVYLFDLLVPVGAFWGKVLSYFKPVADAATAGSGAAKASGPIYPGITQSIREARNMADWGDFFSSVSATSWLGALGALGIVAVLALRPVFALMLPLLGVCVASLFLGVRFAMFGGPAFALGLGIGVDWLGKALFRRSPSRGRALVALQVALAAACLLGYWGQYSKSRPSPVVAPVHAEALMKLKGSIPKGAAIWTWWDFGYAAQYYAERMTPSDGGKHAGRDIFATALALTTPSYRQAAQVILLSAGLDNEPARRWDKMPAQAVRQELLSLAEADVPLRRPPTQYLVVCWENITLLHWIAYYGSWDVVSGSGTHAKTDTVGEPFNVDQGRGLMVFRGPSRPLPIKSVDQLTPQGTRRVSFAGNPAGPHLLVNEAARQVVLMDDLAYNSMAVQLLIGDPARPELSRYFKLVHEGYPLVRIYEVLPPASEPQGQAEAFTQ